METQLINKEQGKTAFKGITVWIILALIVLIFVADHYAEKRGYSKGNEDGYSRALERVQTGEIDCPEKCIISGYDTGYNDAIFEIKKYGIENIDKLNSGEIREP